MLPAPTKPVPPIVVALSVKFVDATIILIVILTILLWKMTFVSVRVTALLPESVQVIGFHKILIDLFAMNKISGYNSCECLFYAISSNVLRFDC